MPFTPDEDLRYRALLATLRHLWADLKQVESGTNRWLIRRSPAYLDIEAKILKVGQQMQRMLGVVAARDAPRKKE